MAAIERNEDKRRFSPHAEVDGDYREKSMRLCSQALANGHPNNDIIRIQKLSKVQGPFPLKAAKLAFPIRR